MCSARESQAAPACHQSLCSWATRDGPNACLRPPLHPPPPPPDNGTEFARIGAGSCFGELALLSKGRRAANVMALVDSQVSTCAPYRQCARVEALIGLPQVARDLQRHGAGGPTREHKQYAMVEALWRS